jgi:hypothetical protein
MKSLKEIIVRYFWIKFRLHINSPWDSIQLGCQRGKSTSMRRLDQINNMVRQKTRKQYKFVLLYTWKSSIMYDARSAASRSCVYPGDLNQGCSGPEQIKSWEKCPPRSCSSRSSLFSPERLWNEFIFLKLSFSGGWGLLKCPKAFFLFFRCEVLGFFWH